MTACGLWRVTGAVHRRWGSPGLAQLTAGRLVDRDQPCHTYPPRGDAAATTVRARQSLVLFSRLSVPHPADPTDTVTAQRSCYRCFMPSHAAGRRGSSPSTYARIGTGMFVEQPAEEWISGWSSPTAALAVPPERLRLSAGSSSRGLTGRARSVVIAATGNTSATMFCVPVLGCA